LILCIERLPREQHLPAPIFGQILPAWVHLFNQRDLLLPAPAFLLPFSVLGLVHIVVALVINQAVTLVLSREPIKRAGFVLENARIDEAGHARIQRPGGTGHNVHPEPVKHAVAHGGNGSMRVLAEIP
jgi:hypothetical protein